MSWDQIVNTINAFFNTPVPIICCSVGSLLIFIIAVISKTSIGKKALNKLTKQYNEITDIYQKAKVDYEKHITELKQDYETKLALVQAKRDDVEKLLIYVCENTNNKKVKEALELYKQSTTKVVEISDLVSEKEKEVRKECEEKLNYFESQVKNKLIELDALIKEKQEEIENGGKQENTDTIKEEI